MLDITICFHHCNRHCKWILTEEYIYCRSNKTMNSEDPKSAGMRLCGWLQVITLVTLVALLDLLDLPALKGCWERGTAAACSKQVLVRVVAPFWSITNSYLVEGMLESLFETQEAFIDLARCLTQRLSDRWRLPMRSCWRTGQVGRPM